MKLWFIPVMTVRPSDYLWWRASLDGWDAAPGGSFSVEVKPSPELDAWRAAAEQEGFVFLGVEP